MPLLQILRDVGKILAVFGLVAHRERFELSAGNPLVRIRDFLNAGHIHTLPLLDGRYEVGSLEEAVVRAGIEPGHAAAEDFDGELSPLEVRVVDGGNLDFATRRRLHVFRDLNDGIIVKIETGNGVMRFGLHGFFFDRQGFALPVELDDAVRSRVFHEIPENSPATLASDFCCGVPERSAETTAIKDIVAKDKRTGVARDKLFAHNEGVGEPSGLVLYCVIEFHAEPGAIAKKLTENTDIARSRNNEHLADPGEHQDRQRVVDHGFVIERQDLLGNGFCDGIQAGTGPSGKDDSFHINSFLNFPVSGKIKKKRGFLQALPENPRRRNILRRVLPSKRSNESMLMVQYF